MSKSKKTVWDRYVENSEDDYFRAIIDDKFLLRRISRNYMIIKKGKSCQVYYYSSLRESIKNIIDLVAEDRLKGCKDVDELKEILKDISNNLEEIVPDLDVLTDSYNDK